MKFCLKAFPTGIKEVATVEGHYLALQMDSLEHPLLFYSSHSRPETMPLFGLCPLSTSYLPPSCLPLCYGFSNCFRSNHLGGWSLVLSFSRVEDFIAKKTLHLVQILKGRQCYEHRHTELDFSFGSTDEKKMFPIPLWKCSHDFFKHMIINWRHGTVMKYWTREEEYFMASVEIYRITLNCILKKKTASTHYQAWSKLNYKHFCRS